MKAFAAIGILLLVIFGGAFHVSAGEMATPQEVIEKVKEARGLLSGGRGDLEEFKRADGRWVFKDTYVFIIDMDSVTVVAHPVNPKQVGKNLIGLKDVKGNYFFIQFCEKARTDGGGWVEYWWPKPGEKTPSRKYAYVMPVPGTSLMLGAGVYDDSVTVDELNKLVKK